jgi:hypothetical protein
MTRTMGDGIGIRMQRPSWIFVLLWKEEKKGWDQWRKKSNHQSEFALSMVSVDDDLYVLVGCNLCCWI